MQPRGVIPTAWDRCRALASSPCILDAVIATMQKMGVAGKERSAKILYLPLVTRYLPRPVSIAVKGPSSSGKSYLPEIAALALLRLPPPHFDEPPGPPRMPKVWHTGGSWGFKFNYSQAPQPCLRFET